jgi:hypothetical protein
MGLCLWAIVIYFSHVAITEGCHFWLLEIPCWLLDIENEANNAMSNNQQGIANKEFPIAKGRVPYAAHYVIAPWCRRQGNLLAKRKAMQESFCKLVGLS